MSARFDVVDDHSIGVKCLHCENNKFHKPLYVIADLENMTYMELRCKKCFKNTYVGFFWQDGEVHIAVRDSEF